MKKIAALLFFVILLSMVLSACGSLSIAGGLLPSITAPATATQTPTIVPTLTPVPPTPLPSATFTPLPTLTPTATFTPSPSPTPLWIFNPAGRLVAPILLYHHISDNIENNRYYVSIDSFRQQMQSLRDWGYTSLTPSKLLDVLIYGGELPPRPVVITFDDGNQDVYQNAFPIMKEMGFTGGFYIVGQYLNAKDFVTTDELKEMIAAGWEIGSHSESHLDLTTRHDDLRYELLDSRTDLETELGVPVKTIAYPFGKIDEMVINKTQEYGYRGGMGLGTINTHTWSVMYYLSRREVHGDMDLTTFSELLPWSGTP